jgi:hypothetical protein
MTPLETAILRTILYADVFDFPLTRAEIQHFLIHDAAVTHEQINQTLTHSARLQEMLVEGAGYVALASRAHLLAVRQQRDAASAHLWPLAVRYGRWLAHLPFVRMVAITGALAVRNASSTQDDIDYLLITTPNRVWLARAGAILLVRLIKLSGIVICPNYVLAENTLEQDRKDLFIAHEITQMIPLYGHGLYQRFRAANPWVGQHMANAHAPLYAEADAPRQSLLKRLLETVLRTRLGDWLEQWEYRRKLRRFAPEMQNPHSSARLDQSQVKGHFNDYGHRVMERYHQRLQEYGLDTNWERASAD